VTEGIYRIPLPLPLDALRAVNVYVLVDGAGLTLIDGGWAIPEARTSSERGLSAIGAGFRDIRRFLVTHVHRDHYTLASALGAEYGAEVALGMGDRPSLDLVAGGVSGGFMLEALETAGAEDVVELWRRGENDHDRRPGHHYQMPDLWLKSDTEVEAGARTLHAVHTPGHTPGHFVFAERSSKLLSPATTCCPRSPPRSASCLPYR
jgi:glyoxylase-like metal-dependent hydrolase (beta-lactamase superfamily II)